jgi:hypothetical protein
MADDSWAPPESDFAPPAAAAWSPPESDFASATPVAAAAPEAPAETAGRVSGLGERAIIKGIGQLTDVPGALVSLADRAGKGLHDYTRHLLGLPEDTTEAPPETAPMGGSRGADAVSDVFGLPSPATPAERVGSAAISSLPSAALAPETPIASAISNMAGGAANQGAAEAGAGPVGRTIAGLLGGGISAAGSGIAAGARGIVRGGAQGQSAMQSRLADASANSTPLSLGQASGSTPIQYLEGSLSKLPGSGPLKALPGQQAESLGDNVSRIVDNLSRGNVASPMTAGNAINAGADQAKQSMHAAESAAFAKRDALVPPTTPTNISGTLATLDKLATPTTGAEATTGSLLSPKISKMRDDLTADAAAAGATTPATAAIPYNAVRQLRTAVGNSIDWGFAPADPVTNGGLKQVWGALSDDLTGGASAVSPAAKQAAGEANALYAQNQTKREFLNGIIDKAGGPESVYQAATNGTKQGATKINGVMSAIGPDQQNLVRATVLDKLGRASGAQDVQFSPSTFLTNWTKLDPAAKDAMFGASGAPQTLRSSLDSLTSTMGNIRAGTKLQNWSGSGEAVGHAGGTVAAFEGLKSLMTGEPHIAASVAGGFAANNLLSRALTNPRIVNWFEKSTKAPPSALPNAVNQLSKMDDPDAQDLASYLAPPVARASGGRVSNIEGLVAKLMNRWKAAKRETDKSTKPLLKMPDATIVKALDIAGRAI